MNKLNYTTDPMVAAESMYRLAAYTLKDEVTNWVEGECKEDHIFVDALIVANFIELDEDSFPHRLYELSKELIDKFDESKADEVMELVGKLPWEMGDLFQYVNMD